jgi:stress-induced morphogen
MKQKLTSHFKEAQVIDVEDRDGCENSFAIRIVSDDFNKKILI